MKLYTLTTNKHSEAMTFLNSPFNAFVQDGTEGGAAVAKAGGLCLARLYRLQRVHVYGRRLSRRR